MKKDNTISFFIPGNARSVQRKNRTGGGRVYEDKSSRAYGWKMRVAAACLEHRPRELWDCPLRLSLMFMMKRPASRKDEIWVTTTPDLDNMEKVLIDAMEGLLFVNDKQVVMKDSIKIYCSNVNNVGVMVRLSKLRTLWLHGKF